MSDYQKKYKNIDKVSEFVIRAWGKQAIFIAYAFYDSNKELLESGNKEKITTALSSIITLAISMYLEDTLSSKTN
jgi:hypothetical protein